MITVAPPCWKRSAIALPAPFVPPVISTRLPLNSFGSAMLFDDVVIAGWFENSDLDPIAHAAKQRTFRSASKEIVRKSHRHGADVVQPPDLFRRESNFKALEIVFELSEFPCADNWNNRDGAITQPRKRDLGCRYTYFFCHGDNLAHGAQTRVVYRGKARLVDRGKPFHHFRVQPERFAFASLIFRQIFPGEQAVMQRRPS